MAREIRPARIRLPRPTLHSALGTALCTALAGVLLAGSGALTAAVAAPSAASVQDPIPVQPNTAFFGLVNGKTVGATILVGCFGPIVPGQTGHPLAGQYVQADSTLPVTTTDGYTGSAAHSLTAVLATPVVASTDVIGTLPNFFAPVAIPTTLTVPCSGPGQVLFVPEPTSPTARSASVAVSFVGQP